MGARELRRERTLRRIWESVVATVLGGLIVWSLTSSKLQPATERVAAAVTPTVAPIPVASAALPTPIAPSRSAGPVVQASPPPLVSLPAPAVTPASVVAPASTVASAPAVVPALKPFLTPYSVPLGSILLYEDFSHYREGEPTDWGPNTFIQAGLDHRHWLGSSADGTHPIGCRVRLPSEFYLECRYAGNLPEITRGLLGWWKEPVATTITFRNDQGVAYVIPWVIRCGNDTTRLNPLGSLSLCPKKYYHTFTLPDGATNEVGIQQPTGLLRIERDNSVIRIFLDGQAAIAGTMTLTGQLVGFEIGAVKTRTGSLFFTDFKIGR
jgi:hypothetical protein